jgi:hypothetical protein
VIDMRERTTWNRDQIKQAAMKRQADPYTMNQDHPQPAADAYVIGGPSEFAEDVNKDNRWEDEYAGGAVKRDEIGMPDMRSETFNHPEKTAAMDEATLLKKANICIKTAKLMLPKTAKEAAIEDQAVALMNLPDYDLFETFTRLASDDQDADDQGDQDKQAGQMPPQFKENAEKKKEEAEAKKDDDDKGEQKQAAQQQFSQQQIQEMVAQQIQQIQAQQAEQAAQQQQAQQQAEQAAQQQQAPVAQQDIQALIAEQVQQQMAQMQQHTCGKPMAQQDPVQADEEILFDDPPAGEMDIQMDAPLMDTGDVVLGPEDDVLQSLFANDESQAQQDIQDQQGQQKQASAPMSRTASTRTVGTKPSAGVSRIGGTPAAPASNELDRLSGLWQSAPDVRDAFGLPNK